MNYEIMLGYTATDDLWRERHAVEADYEHIYFRSAGEDMSGIWAWPDPEEVDYDGLVLMPDPAFASGGDDGIL